MTHMVQIKWPSGSDEQVVDQKALQVAVCREFNVENKGGGIRYFMFFGVQSSADVTETAQQILDRIRQNIPDAYVSCLNYPERIVI